MSWGFSGRLPTTSAAPTALSAAVCLAVAMIASGCPQVVDNSGALSTGGKCVLPGTRPSGTVELRTGGQCRRMQANP
jgi:hypothetical protein